MHGKQQFSHPKPSSADLLMDLSQVKNLHYHSLVKQNCENIRSTAWKSNFSVLDISKSWETLIMHGISCLPLDVRSKTCH